MSFFTLIGLAIALGGIVLLVQGIQGRQAASRGLGSLVLVVGIVVTIFSQAFVIVPAGNVGVVFNILTGVQDKELDEGVKIVLPVLQQVTLFNAREQALTFAEENADEIAALSEEGLEIEIDATIRYRINRNEAASIYQNLGNDYAQTLIRPTVRSVVRGSIAKYKATDAISTRRSDLENQIKAELEISLAEKNVILIDALLRDIRIPASVRSAIEEKQTAEQRVQIEENLKRQAEIAAQRKVTEAEGDRDAAIARAEGDAEALSLKGRAIRENPEIIDLEVAQRLAPTIQTIMLPSDGSFLLDVGGITNGTSGSGLGR